METVKLSYIEICDLASKEQGIDDLVLKLAELGVVSTSEQTGGFNMCACVRFDDGSYIYANALGAGLYSNQCDFDRDLVSLDEQNISAVAHAVALFVKQKSW